MTVATIAAILVAATGQNLQISTAPCPAYQNDSSVIACTNRNWPIYAPRFREESRVEYRRTILHELGHQVDFRIMTDTDRGIFRRINNNAHPWTADYHQNPIGELWAEAFAFCNLSHQARKEMYWWERGHLQGTDYEYHPTKARIHAACRLIRTVVTRPALENR